MINVSFPRGSAMVGSIKYKVLYEDGEHLFSPRVNKLGELAEQEELSLISCSFFQIICRNRGSQLLSYENKPQFMMASQDCIDAPTARTIAVTLFLFFNFSFFLLLQKPSISHHTDIVTNLPFINNQMQAQHRSPL